MIYNILKTNTMITIGFATKMYTLWNVYSRVEYGVNMGVKYEYTRHFFDYIKNLSIDLETAKQKAEEFAGIEGYVIDLEQKGHNSYSYTVGEKRDKKEEIELTPEQFPYGKLKGGIISDCFDVYHLNRLYNDRSSNPRSRVYARTKLLEIGDLIKIEKEFLSEDIKYISERSYENYKKNILISRAEKGLFFNDGEKVTLKVKQIHSFSFQTQFGTSYVVLYIDSENRIFKYVGASPKTFNTDDYVEIKATIKHSSYNDNEETKLLRIKQI